jgi:hypothetical protein
MPYNQYTSCVQAPNHVKMDQYIQATIQASIAGGIGALFVAAAGMPWCLLVVVEIAAMMWLLAYCHWWLDDRLICLGGDKLAIGMLISVEPPEEKSGFDALDTDYSINLLLPPNMPGAGQAAVESSLPYGFLTKEQDATRNIGLPFTGYPAIEKKTGIPCAGLHAEFEGGGVKDTLLGAQIALGLSVAALIVCLGVPGPIGAVIAAILALLALLAALLGAGVGLGDKGSPADVNPSLGNLHVNDTNKIGADLLVVMGRWVYDAGHNNQDQGWNEIHAIKFCERIGRWTGSWPADIGDLEKKWEGAVDDATSALTVAAQQKPENQWEVHPALDGCRPRNNDPH